MRKTLTWIVLTTLFLASCAVETVESPGLDAADELFTVEVTPTPTPTDEPTPEPSLTPTEAPTETFTAMNETTWVAFIGNDGNIRLVDRTSGKTRDISSDATQPDYASGEKSISYYFPMWSSDGAFLAYQREVGVAVEGGYDFSSEMWIYEVGAGNSRPLIIEQRVSRAAWQPGTHTLAITFGVDENYFTARGEVDSTKANGIWGINVDTGESQELVQPEQGYSLSWLKWSNDGRFLFFHEILYYEGSGSFSYYDFKTGTYTATGEIIGSTDLSPDNQMLVYDTLTYVPSGDEKIYLRPLSDGEPVQFSPDYEQGYAFSPIFSPSGDEIAYLAEIGSLESMQYTLFVQALGGGEPLPLGAYENAQYLNWLPDESGLILSIGPYETRQILEVSLADGSDRVLAEGDAPALQPTQP